MGKGRTMATLQTIRWAIPRTHVRAGGPALALASALALTACGVERTDKADIEIRSAGPATTGAAGDAGGLRVVDTGNGIRDYGDYQAAVAREGETIAELARRIGLSATELGAYNGLAPAHVLKAGDELALPPRPGGYATERIASDGLAGANAEPVIVATPLDDRSAGADEAWSPEIAARAIARAAGAGPNDHLAAPPSSAGPLPSAPEAPEPPRSPDLRRYQTEARTEPASPVPAGTQASADGGARVANVTAPETTPVTTPETTPTPDLEPQALPPPGIARFQRPVQGPVAIGYGQGAGGVRNEGIDFAAAPGTPVVAANDGEVALVSESLGNLGTIVLLRHGDGLLTVYGRVTDVTLAKGATVSRGQRIGEVAEPPRGEEARMHFEVRRGAESLDPATFLGDG